MKTPVRVLHVVGSLNRGGTETMIMNLYRHIDRSKVQFDFVVHTQDQCDYEDEIYSLGGQIYRIPRFKGVNIKTYMQAWRNFFLQHEYKIVHGHIVSCASIYLYIARKKDSVTIAHSHSVKSPLFSLKRIVLPIITYPIRYIAHYFFACSMAAGVDCFGKKVTNSKRFSVLKNAIDASEYIYSSEIRNLMRKKLGIEDRFVIGHVGRFVPAKNHKRLLRIFQSLKRINNKAVLLLVGDGKLKIEIEKQVDELGLNDSVIFTGLRSDISKIVQAMDVFVFPSIFEGLGLVVIEAQAAGLPCIVSDALPKEAFITDIITPVSLKEPDEVWVSLIQKYAEGYCRKETISEIKNNGYDVHDTAKWLEEFYLMISGDSYEFRKEI